MRIYMALDVETYQKLQTQLRGLEKKIVAAEKQEAHLTLNALDHQREALTSVMARMFPVVIDDPAPTPMPVPETEAEELKQQEGVSNFLRKYNAACEATQDKEKTPIQTLDERLKDDEGYYTNR